MQLLMYPACFMTQKLDKISFRTRNHGSKVTPSDIIVLRVFFSFSFFQPFGHFYAQCICLKVSQK